MDELTLVTLRDGLLADCRVAADAWGMARRRFVAASSPIAPGPALRHAGQSAHLGSGPSLSARPPRFAGRQTDARSLRGGPKQIARSAAPA